VLAAAAPVDAPLHNTFVCDEIVVEAAVGWVIVTVAVDVHPFASVAVTVYDPAAKPVAVAPVAELLHKYVFVPVPPVALTVAEPVDAPLHKTFTCDEIVAETAVGWVNVELAVAVNPPVAVTVTVYVPAARPVMAADVAPLLQE
jgi:hypothetical protein